MNVKYDVLSSYISNYLEHKFVESNSAINFNFKSEKFITTWKHYKSESLDNGVFNILKEKLAQLNFPIQQGISSLNEYRNATLKGKKIKFIPLATGLILKQPELLELSIVSGPVGEVPVLTVPNPYDFADIVRALAHKNEPVEIPATMGASLIRGINNWDRIRSLKRDWESESHTRSWNEFFRKNILPNKNLYQDSLIVLSKKNYSGISADSLALNSTDWLSDSLKIRLHHEYSHYFTLRYFGGMYANIYDEILADYLGISMTYGKYNHDLFLKFMGLENYPEYRVGARFENYIEMNQVSPSELDFLKDLCYFSSLNIEKFDNYLGYSSDIYERIKRLLVLCKLDFKTLASSDAIEKMITTYKNVIVSKIPSKA